MCNSRTTEAVTTSIKGLETASIATWYCEYFMFLPIKSECLMKTTTYVFVFSLFCSVSTKIKLQFCYDFRDFFLLWFLQTIILTATPIVPSGGGKRNFSSEVKFCFVRFFTKVTQKTRYRSPLKVHTIYLMQKKVQKSTNFAKIDDCNIWHAISCLEVLDNRARISRANQVFVNTEIMYFF